MDKKLMTPHEAEIDKLLQIMACLVAKMGGEVIINRQELQSFFDTPVLTQVISGDYIRLYLKDEDQYIVESIDLPEENPQT